MMETNNHGDDDESRGAFPHDDDDHDHDPVEGNDHNDCGGSQSQRLPVLHRLDRKRQAVQAANAGPHGIHAVLQQHAQTPSMTNSSETDDNDIVDDTNEPQLRYSNRNNSNTSSRQFCVEQSVQHWNAFFQRNKAAFYKDKHHLRAEFFEMMPPHVQQAPKQWHSPLMRRHADLSQYSFPLDAPPPAAVWNHPPHRFLHFLELGCGVGNAAFPLLRANPNLFGWCVDFAESSIQILKASHEYDPERMYAFHADITQPHQLERHLPSPTHTHTQTQTQEHHLPPTPPPFQFDYITAVWVLSALDPRQLPKLLTYVFQHILKPGGILFMRDYAVGDLSQLRMDPATCKIDTNFYMCGDGTLRYFLDYDSTHTLFAHDIGFEVLDLQIVQRTVNNYKENMRMERFWIQGKFRKPEIVRRLPVD